MPLIYKCLYFNTPLINEFNEIKVFIIFELISLGFNRFNMAKKVIEKGPLNECIIRIVIKKAIYIGLIKPGFKTIIQKEKIELFGLLRKVETSFLLIKDQRFLKKAHESYKAKEMHI